MCWHELLKTVSAGNRGKGWMDLRSVTKVRSHWRLFLCGVMSCLYSLCVYVWGLCNRRAYYLWASRSWEQIYAHA